MTAEQPPEPRRRWGVFTDTTPFRESVPFRWLYGGQVVSSIGQQLTVVAAAYQVFVLTHSSFLVGLLSLVQLVPLLAGAAFGGAIVDAFDRRLILLMTGALLCAISVGLALTASLHHPPVWAVFVLMGLGAGVSAVDSPARNAAVPGLVRRDLLSSAAALNQLLFQVAAVAGPSLAGIIISDVSLPAAYWLDAASFIVAAVTLVFVGPLKPHGGGTRVGLQSVRDGLSYLRTQRALQGTFWIDLNAMIFGMPRALFPYFGLHVFGGTARTVGFLYAAPGVGALIGAGTAGWVVAVRRQGRAVLIAVIVWGVAITAFGLVSALPAALVLLAVAGAADVVSAVFRNTILQLTVPDRLRGRLSAIHIAVVTGGPRMGDFESGLVAGLTTPRISVVTGGLACLIGVAVVAWLVPQLGRTVRTSDGVGLEPAG